MEYNIKTYQDWLEAGDKEKFILEAVHEYIASHEYAAMLEAEAYFLGENPAIDKRPKWKVTKTGKEVDLSKSVIKSNYFYRFLLQINQFLLTNGVQLENDEIKALLGKGFDKTFEQAGESALLFGVSWLFKDIKNGVGKVKFFSAKEFLPLYDERTGELMTGIRFWRIAPEKPFQIELYEPDGVTDYVADDKGSLILLNFKRAYKNNVKRYPHEDFAAELRSTENYGGLPIVPFYANDYHRSTFTEPVKTKIDAFDRVMSDFDNNLDRANDVYWVLENFGGTKEEVLAMIADINEIKATYAIGNDQGNAAAEPRTIEVPYAARQIALEILRKELYADYMAMDINEITGGSLTNVAIDTAKFNLSLTCTKFENQAFATIQKLLSLNNVETENIKFKKQTVANETENINNVIAEYEAGLLDTQTAIEKLDNVDMDEVQSIMERRAVEEQKKADETFPINDTGDKDIGGGEIGQGTPADE